MSGLEAAEAEHEVADGARAAGTARKAPPPPPESGSKIVIDLGASSVKAGFAGETSCETYDCRELPCSERIHDDTGVITEWDALETLLSHGFSELNVQSPSEHPVLLADVPLTPECQHARPGRERKSCHHTACCVACMARGKALMTLTASVPPALLHSFPSPPGLMQMMFEKFDVPRMYMASTSLLSLYATGRTTGIVVDGGHILSQIVPIYEGGAVAHGMKSLDFGGRDLWDYMQTLSTAEHPHPSSAARHVFLKGTRVALNFAADVSKPPEGMTLPDGTQVAVGEERFRVPEALFQPAFIGKGTAIPPYNAERLRAPDEASGIHAWTYDCIMRCSADIRGDLFKNIVLSGGSSRFPGMEERLTRELKVASDPRRVKISTAEANSSWVGGSILASLPECHSQIFVTKAEYDDKGPAVVHSRCAEYTTEQV